MGRLHRAAALGLATVLHLLPPANPLEAQAPALLTRAEATGWIETSRHADVVAFLGALARQSPDLHLLTFGYSLEGRALPLAVWAPGTGPQALAEPAMLTRVPGRTRVLVFANIHAGEVEGKEAAQILLRELAGGAHREWADSLLLMVVPIYNADGNERVELTNRPLQHGPIGGMGQRANAQGYDLNRDFMKLDSPEARSLVGLLRDADPHVVIDLHTTNGTLHGYHLTYSPPLHPATDPAIDEYLRDTWLPAVTHALAPGWSVYEYGNLPEDEGFEAERGWYSFDHRPRFSNNYVGVRNRFGILSEAYAYLPFRERAEVTKRFVEAILDFAWANASEIRSRAREADGRKRDEVPVRARIARSTATPVEVLLGEVAEERHPYTGHPMLRRLDVQRPERMQVFGRFEGTETAAVPRAYLVPAELAPVLDRLRAHGIRVEALEERAALDVEEYRITRSSLAEEEFQQHRERTLEGSWTAARWTAPVGTWVVPMDQPLAVLAVLLLDPRSDDGLTTWNVLDPALEEAESYPIRRTRERVPR